MADEAAQVENAEVEEKQSAEEQKTEEIDWKAKARKWERRAKDNQKALDEANKTIADFQSEAEAKKSEKKSADEVIEDLKKQLEESQAAAARNQTVHEVAKAARVDEDVLGLMRGDTKEEIEANAKLLEKMQKTHWPEVKDRGAQKAPGMTLEQILAIKNPKKQLEAAMQNPQAFD